MKFQGLCLDTVDILLQTTHKTAIKALQLSRRCSDGFGFSSATRLVDESRELDQLSLLYEAGLHYVRLTISRETPGLASLIVDPAPKACPRPSPPGPNPCHQPIVGHTACGFIFQTLHLLNALRHFYNAIVYSSTPVL